MSKITEFFKGAFEDMKESAKSQHEVDKANFAAVKAESKVQWEEAKAMANPQSTKNKLNEEREKQLLAANERIEKAEERINAVRK